MIGKKININGQILYAPGYYDDGLTAGRFFKDEDAFNNSPENVCYIPEAFFDDVEPVVANGEEYYDVAGYTRKELEDMVMDDDDNIVYQDAEGEPLNLDYFFSEFKWACPETYLSERYY